MSMNWLVGGREPNVARGLVERVVAPQQPPMESALSANRRGAVIDPALGLPMAPAAPPAPAQPPAPPQGSDPRGSIGGGGLNGMSWFDGFLESPTDMGLLGRIGFANAIAEGRVPLALGGSGGVKQDPLKTPEGRLKFAFDTMPDINPADAVQFAETGDMSIFASAQRGGGGGYEDRFQFAVEHGADGRQADAYARTNDTSILAQLPGYRRSAPPRASVSRVSSGGGGSGGSRSAVNAKGDLFVDVNTGKEYREIVNPNGSGSTTLIDLSTGKPVADADRGALDIVRQDGFNSERNDTRDRQAKDEDTAFQLASEAGATLGLLDEIESAAGGAVSPGVAADATRALAQMFGVDIGGFDLTNITSFNQARMELSLRLARQYFQGQGQVTENERKMLADSLPRIDSDPEAFRTIVGIMRRAAQRSQEEANAYLDALDAGEEVSFSRFRRRQRRGAQSNQNSGQAAQDEDPLGIFSR